MRYGLSGAGLVSLGDTLLLTGGVGRAGILKAINRFIIISNGFHDIRHYIELLRLRPCFVTNS